jgi:hypothetical protein
MSQFNDKHLLWWVLKIIDDVYHIGRNDLLDEYILKDAPEWVAPALREKYEQILEETHEANRSPSDAT